MKQKITTGANDRPKDETIAQTGPGLPDDRSSVIEVDHDGVATPRQTGPAQPDAVEKPEPDAREAREREKGNKPSR